MNTDKIYAEHIANEYSAKKESKVIAWKVYSFRYCYWYFWTNWCKHLLFLIQKNTCKFKS